MAWTAPRTWSVGEIVTAAFMNTHVRDNLKYLKGQAGTIAFEDGATFAASVAVTGGITATTSIAATTSLSGASLAVAGTGGNLITATGSATTTSIAVTSPNVASQDARLVLTNTGQRAAAIYMDRANDRLRIAQNTTSNPAITITPAGNVGILNTLTAQGALHVYDTIGGALYWEFDGVDGALRTIIPNAAGDVQYGLFAKAVVRHSGTGTVGGLDVAILTPGNTVNLYNVGGNTLTLAVAADGSVTVQRTAGTGTYKVAFWLLWL